MPANAKAVLRPGDEQWFEIVRGSKRHYHIENLCGTPYVSWTKGGFDRWYSQRRGFPLEKRATIVDGRVVCI